MRSESESVTAGALPTERERLPRLNRRVAGAAAQRARVPLAAPSAALMDLPEKAVQFGTGGFLRGFIEPLLDAANQRDQFGGRIVMIGSTGSGRDRALEAQDGLFTLSVRGIDEGAVRDDHVIITAASRALSAATQWDEVLACARNPQIELVFSNTTEIGIVLDEDDRPDLVPPRSFPGKLTRFLYERAQTFDFDAARGVTVIPCELIEHNGDRLRAIVLELAQRWSLDTRFSAWLDAAVQFCNTLVDRIVPGTPAGEALDELSARLGYRDDLLTVAEPYSLLAIEGDDALRARLRFAHNAPGIIVTPDVMPYRERKVRLLNGAHTAMVPAALLAGCTTVREAMEHEDVGRFTRRLLLDDIVPTLAVPDAEVFARTVLDRFANPFLEHPLFDITLHGTAKLRVRVVPSIMHYAHAAAPPQDLAFAFAAFLLLLRGDLQAQRAAAGLAVPLDPAGDAIRTRWDAVDTSDPHAPARLVADICGDAELWGADLASVPGFAAAVTTHLTRALRDGVPAALREHLNHSAS